jgi:hypothetical protein
LEGDFTSHLAGRYRIAFQAELTEPYFVKLMNPRSLSIEERDLLDNWSTATDWINLAKHLRP